MYDPLSFITLVIPFLAINSIARWKDINAILPYVQVCMQKRLYLLHINMYLRWAIASGFVLGMDINSFLFILWSSGASLR
ncbi:hypothetical protein L1987_77639 [Smallanthus sonchifolius]|uniref:Uncharacterized protein n=1 Tax=Smallanthus sonchifolius TaxID=185202 RepID=A0ACB8ZAB1_9ASTR|nr:hypothetical protein L1987_77639 [Smallanthus sonchifolius]